MLLVREHRGSLADSMETVRSIRDRAELVAVIRESLAPFGQAVDDKQIIVEPYGRDDRIGWDTHLISIEGYGVWGMANGPITSPPAV